MEWLKTCSVEHPQSCNMQSARGTLPRRLPARLLDTGIVKDGVISVKDLAATSIEKMHNICICASESLPKDTPYLTLSHRWSRSPVLVLNNNTLQAFQKSIPHWVLLSREAAIFRHANEVARSLGFRYLWIDALCINQDDEDEKSSEITRMSEIYSTSMLNISATAASSASHGLFFDRDPLLIEPYVQRAKEIAADLVAYTDCFFEEVEQGPVNTRGWVFQERILSPRIIHFGREQVFWECNSFRAAAAFPQGCPGLKSVFGTRLKNWASTDHQNSLISYDIGQEAWAMLVSAYASTSITYPQDRLLAISAVARRLCVLRGLRERDYIAGLWRPDLLWQLLWIVAALPNRNASVLTTYRARSWSWASVPMTQNGGIMWNLQERGEIIAELVDVCVSSKTTDVFGEITSGKITIRGPLCKMATALQHYSGKSMGMSWDFPLHLARWQSLGSENLYLMPIQLYQKPHKTALDISGLILKPIGEVQGYVMPGCYVRTGAFLISTKKDDWEGKYLDVFAAMAIQSKDYVAFDGLDKYTIEII
jgi:hypothetical protein